MGGSKTTVRIVSAVAAFLLTLGAVELVLIGVDYQYRPLRIEDRRVLQLFKSNPNDARVTHAFEDDNFVFDPALIWRPKPGKGPFNEQGFRGPVLNPKKAGGERRVFAVGDSNTLGWSGPGGGNWPGELQTLLGEPGKPFLVVNAGVYGYSSYQGARRFKEILTYQPDLALVSFGSNDAHPVAVTDADFAQTIYGPKAPALAMFRLGQLFLAARESLSISLYPTRSPRVPLPDYDANLEWMVRQAKERGIGCVLMTRPYIGETSDPNLWKSRAAEYRLHTIAVAKREKAALVDLYAWFKDRDAYFADESHFQPEGHRLAALIIAREIAPLLDSLADSPRPESGDRLPDRLFLTLGEPECRSSLGVGFSGDEHGVEGGFVWNEGPVSRLMLSLSPAQGPYTLTIDAACFPPLDPLVVSLSLNGKGIGRLQFGRERTRKSLSISAGSLAWGPNSLLLGYSRVGRPVDFDRDSKDKRDLALQFFSVSVAPAI